MEFQIKISNKYPGIAYDYINGYFYRLKSSNEMDKRIIPDYLGYIIYLCALTNKRIKKKAEILAYEIMLDISLPKNSKLYFKDLNSENFKFWNIGCVSAKQYNTIRDAVYNIQGGIKIIPHAKDAFAHYIFYKTKGRIKMKICHDIVSALKIKRMILITSNKVLSRYITSN